MSDRCLNLKPFEAQAQPSASVIVRPFRIPVRPGAVVRTFSESNAGRCPLWARWWRGVHGDCDWDQAPLAPGDRAILREAWWSDEPDIKRATAKHEDLMSDSPIYYRANEEHPEIFPRWRTPQTMPAALARWRRPVVGVEAVEIGKVSEETWCCAGFEGGVLNGIEYPSQQAREMWLSTYGPGSWSGWCWVVRLGEVEP